MQKGYTYIYEGMYTENSQIFFDTYYQIAYNHKKRTQLRIPCSPVMAILL